MTYDPSTANIDVSNLATKAELNLKANASTVGGLTTAVNSKASQSALDAVAATVPTASSSAPPSVADTGAKGSETTKFALADHTHASKVRKVRVVCTTATLTWTFDPPFASGVVPICLGMAEKAGADLFNVQLDGPPTNTGATFRVNRVSSGLLSLLLGALSINATPASIILHLVAVEP